MRPFRFRLDALLAARRQAERAAQRRVAAVERRRLELEEALRRSQNRIAAAKESLRRTLVGRLDGAALRQEAGASLQAMRCGRELVLQLAGTMRRVEAMRGELLEATRRRQALSLLRDRRHAAWKAARERKETALLDDLAAVRRAPGERTP
jgi:flagellar export protein FliJ